MAYHYLRLKTQQDKYYDADGDKPHPLTLFFFLKHLINKGGNIWENS